MAKASLDKSASTAKDGRSSGKKGQTPPTRKRFQPQPWWLTFVLIMVANWVLMSVLLPEPTYVNIPYTTFKEQVQGGNVEDVTSQGDAIQGTFRNEITYPPSGQNSRTSTHFKTQRPAFADPGLETLL